MNKRTMDEMIAYFNQEVSKMDIAQEHKMALLGMITAIGYESKQQEIVRCKDCKHWIRNEDYSYVGRCELWNVDFENDFYCADGEKVYE